MGLSPWDNVSRTFTTLVWPLSLTSMSNFQGFFCLHVQLATSLCFDIGISSLAQVSITMRQYVSYIHDPNTTLTFELNVKFIGFLTVFLVWATAFLSFDIYSHTIFGSWVYYLGRRVPYILDLCMTLNFGFNIKIIFTMNLCVGKTVLSHNKFGLLVYHHETKYVYSWYICMIFDLKVNIRRVWVNKWILKYICIAIRYFLWITRRNATIPWKLKGAIQSPFSHHSVDWMAGTFQWQFSGLSVPFSYHSVAFQ